MNLKDQMTEDLSPFFDTEEFAEEIKYLHKGSTDYDLIKAHITESGDYGIQSDVPISDRIMVEIIATSIAELNYRDRFLIINSSGEDQDWFMFRYVSGGHRTGTIIFELTKSSRE